EPLTMTIRIRKPIRLPLAAALLLALAACGAPVGEAAPERAHEAHAHPAAPAPEAAEPSGLSVYNLESLWRDQEGGERPLLSLAGRPQVVAMIYTHCGHVCPRILLDMKRIEAEVTRAHPEGVGFVLVSIDPERDTPERLKEYAELARLD